MEIKCQTSSIPSEKKLLSILHVNIEQAGEKKSEKHNPLILGRIVSS